ncbi:MAG: hypothetical protein L6E13_11135 [Firmicutes bacterium]|nr:hypothetical protein [Bacillota bacterium]
MSRNIGRPARRVVLVPDPVYGRRPHRIAWRDRFGYDHELVAAGVQDEWLDTDWDPHTMRLRQRRYWRLLLPSGGLVTVYEEMSLPEGAPGHWVVERVED